jgi:hypothetical protein
VTHPASSKIKSGPASTALSLDNNTSEVIFNFGLTKRENIFIKVVKCYYFMVGGKHNG